MEQGDQCSSSRDDEVDNDSSKSDEIVMIRQIVHQVSEKQMINNDEKSCLEPDFLNSPDLSLAQEVEVTTPGDFSNEENFNLNNQHPNKLNNFLRDDIPVVMNHVQRLNDFSDILKEAKTSNLNVLVKKEEANNEIR